MLMRATIDRSPQSSSEIVQLVIGWTVVSAAALLFPFNALVALPVLLIGGCILGPYFSSRVSVELEEDAPPYRELQPRTTPSSEERLEKALLYKELFREEIISREEYENAVGKLVPELGRGVVGK